jgi:hypothetical protein
LILFLTTFPLEGFNYAYRRSPTISATPNSTTSALPPTHASSVTSNSQPTKVATPVPDKPASRPNSKLDTPSPINGTPGQSERDAPSSTAAKLNGTSSDKEKAKKKDKKENKKDKSETSAPPTPEPPSGISASVGDPSNVGLTTEVLKGSVDDFRSPGDGSAGTRTPKSGKPPRHPWTIFMRMTPQIQVTEAEVRDFFGEAKDGITRVNLPHSFVGKAKLAYVEFGDEEALKAGLDKHAEVCIFRKYKLMHS